MCTQPVCTYLSGRSVKITDLFPVYSTVDVKLTTIENKPREPKKLWLA